ncbi:MAG: hypothetical protein IJY25_05550 [Bacilli bacterium]|nr:hypothetical protein [Bacilli bacterium]
MKNSTFDIIKMFLLFVFVAFLITIFIVLLVVSSDNKLIDSIKEFTKNDTKVLYFSNDKYYSKYPVELFEKYDIEYLYINTTDLSRFEEKKIKDIINSNEFYNTIVIFENGEVVDSIISYNNDEDLLKFFQKHNIIPGIIGNPQGIIENTKDLINSDLMLLYVPYQYNNSLLDQNKILTEITNEYNIGYNMIPAYILSSNQQKKLNNILQISSVDDQIVILVKNKKIIGSIRGINTKNTYLNILYEYKYISEIENYINEIDYDTLNNLVNSNEISVTVITKDDCKYCETTLSVLNKIIIDYNISINLINILDFDSEIAKSVENKLIELGYNDGFTTPLTIITQSNKIIDYIIGASDEKYFVDIFTENGIIK